IFGKHTAIDDEERMDATRRIFFKTLADFGNTNGAVDDIYGDRRAVIKLNHNVGLAPVEVTCRDAFRGVTRFCEVIENKLFHGRTFASPRRSRRSISWASFRIPVRFVWPCVCQTALGCRLASRHRSSGRTLRRSFVKLQYGARRSDAATVAKIGRAHV